MLFQSFSSDEKIFYTVLLPHAPCTPANCYHMQVYIYRLIQYTYCIFKMIHTHIDTPVQAYYILIHIFSSQDTFSFCILCRLQWDWFLYTYTYIQADTYTLNIIHKDTLVQAYIYMLIQSVIDTYTYLALKIHLVFAFFAVYSGIDSYTLIHIFKPIHTHYTQRYASTSIYLYADCWYSYTLIHIFSFQDTFCSYLLCRLK